MKRTPPSPQQILKRHALRACRWLAYLLIVLPVFERIAPKRARLWLDQRLTILERFAQDLIFYRAAQRRVAPPEMRNAIQAALAARRHDVRVKSACSLRAALGGRLRRDLKARGFKARADAILSALRDADALAARLARRMRRGLSRIMSAHSRVLDGLAAVFAAMFCGVARLAPPPDTS